jgi:xylulokinase
VAVNSPTSLGIDVGSSAVKACLVAAADCRILATASSPAEGLQIVALRPGWAEQDPSLWWRHVIRACEELRRSAPDEYRRVSTIGISHQEHGLVLLDRAGEVLRPAIIWCDSRTGSVAQELTSRVGRDRWFSEVLNEPGNFTVSKLAWVANFEPQVYSSAATMLLPGDYIAYRMTGECATTREGLSEGMLYNFARRSPASSLMADVGLSDTLIPQVIDSFGDQGTLTRNASRQLGLSPHARVTFRAGDQHANAVGLGALHPGSAACAAGTSGVIFSVTDQALTDARSRVNTFSHVTGSGDAPRFAVVLCINAAGIAYDWLRRILSTGSHGEIAFSDVDTLAAAVPSGADGVSLLPFGNGAERILGNRTTGFSFFGIDVNRHGPAHVARAALEGIAFAFRLGGKVLDELGASFEVLHAGNSGMFVNTEFRGLVATALGVPIAVHDGSPACGAALGALVGGGAYPSVKAALAERKPPALHDPDEFLRRDLEEPYERWMRHLERALEP